jgi:hypothetical protein
MQAIAEQPDNWKWKYPVIPITPMHAQST